MTEMARRFLRQKSRSTGTMVLVALLVFGATSMLAPSGGAAPVGGLGIVVLLVLGAACVSRDASGGALQMILVRPIRRTEYLFGRYFGLIAAFVLFLVITAVFTLISRGLWYRGAAPLSASAFSSNLGASVLMAVQIAAVLLFFSTFLPGYGDAAAVVVLYMLLSLQTSSAAFNRLASGLRREILPSVAWEKVFAGETPALADAGRAALATALFLCAAAVVFARREFAYGQD